MQNQWRSGEPGREGIQSRGRVRELAGITAEREGENYTHVIVLVFEIQSGILLIFVIFLRKATFWKISEFRFRVT